MKIVIVIPPRVDGRWVGREDKHGGFGRITIPYTACQIHSMIKRDLPEAKIKILECQRDELNRDEALERLEKMRPDVVVCFLSWAQLNNDRALAETNFPTIGVILQQFIDQREAVEHYDLRCNWFTKQEVEQPIIKGLREIACTGNILKTPGFIVRTNQGSLKDTGNVSPADMTTFPMPSFDAFKLEKYFSLRRKAGLPEPVKIHLNTMKGCLYRCSFCGQANRGQGVRTQSVSQVGRQIRFLIKRYDVTNFLFFDNEFAVDMERAKGLCMEFIKLPKPIRFEINNRVELFDNSLINLLAEAGCIGVRCGIETCDPVTQAVLKKRINLEAARKTLRDIKATGMRVHLYMTPGIPGETRKTLDMNARFIAEVDADTFSYGALSLMPNSDFYNEYKKKGWINEQDWSVYFSQSKLCFKNSSYNSMEEIRKAQQYMLSQVEVFKKQNRIA